MGIKFSKDDKLMILEGIFEDVREKLKLFAVLISKNDPQDAQDFYKILVYQIDRLEKAVSNVLKGG